MYGQLGYSANNPNEDLGVDEFTELPFLEHMEYYTQYAPRLGTGEITFPKFLTLLLDNFYSFEKTKKDYFTSSCTLFVDGLELKDNHLTFSLAVIALITAIETLITYENIGVSRKHCKECNRPIYNVHQNFLDFYEKKVKNFSTSKRIRFLIQILSRANYYFVKYLDKIEDEIDRTEVTLMQSMRNKDVIHLFNLQKTLIYFNRAILANGIVLDNIFKGRVVKLYEDDKELLDDIITENKQSLEMTTTYYNILNNTIAAYSSLVSNNLNSVMKLLTSLTIIMSIPVILASLYGMNVRLPLQDNPSAFAFMLLLSLLMSTVITIIFIKKKYL